jgi:hypothetical protein
MRPNSIEREVDDEPLEVIFETMDAAEATVVGSLLDSAGIAFLTQSDDRFDAFPGAFRETVFSRRGRPVRFLVRNSEAADARALIESADE